MPVAFWLALPRSRLRPIAAQSAIPDFSSTAWQGPNGGEFLAVPGSPAPNRQDPAHPFVSNAEANRTGKQPNYRLADLSNPNIKQWAKDIMKKDNEEVIAGKIAYTPGQSCKPSGIPYFMLSGGPYFFVQTREAGPDHHRRRTHGAAHLS